MCDKKNKVLFTDTEYLVLSPDFKLPDESQFCELKGIKKDFSVPRTPQPNGIAERKNRTLIEAVRTMLADSLPPIPFWAEAVNTACYVQNRVGPTWLFDIDSLTRTMNYQPVTAGNQSNPSADVAFDGKEHDVDTKKHESSVNVSPSSSAQSGEQDDKTKKKAKGKSPAGSFIRNRDLSAEFEDYSDNSSNDVNATGSIVLTAGQNSSNITNHISTTGPSNTTASLTHGKSSFKDASQLLVNPDMLEMKDITYVDHENDNVEDAASDGKEHDVDTKKPESTVNVSPSSSAQSGKQDDMTKKKPKGKSPVESFTRNRDLSAEFEDYSDNSSNDVNATGSIVPAAGKNYSNNTNPFSAAGPSNTTASPTHGKSSFKDAS
nr:putative ribonuclease H-like domain-containing protein [Tanacetum cinerariifolium]